MFKRLSSLICHRENDRLIRWAKLIVLSALLGFTTYVAAATPGGIRGMETVICFLVGAIVRL